MKLPSGPEPGPSASVMFASPFDTFGESPRTRSCVTITSCRLVSMAGPARAHEPSSKGAPFPPGQDFAVSRGPAKQVDPEPALSKAMTEFRAKGCVGSDLNELLEAMGLRRKSLYGTVGQRA